MGIRSASDANSNHATKTANAGRKAKLIKQAQAAKAAGRGSRKV